MKNVKVKSDATTLFAVKAIKDNGDHSVRVRTYGCWLEDGEVVNGPVAEHYLTRDHSLALIGALMHATGEGIVVCEVSS